jgi:thiol-disulfide isomerase/thioredoxin
MPRRRSVLQLLAAGPLLAAARPLPGLAQPGRPAPDFAGVDAWLNTPEPLTLTGLRGHVVLVDFWTYSCINCRRTVPYLNRWQAEYGEKGLQVVGIHTPEFGFEHMRRNVADSVQEFGIRFPVGQDNGFHTWRDWHNRAWPTFYLLDRDGRIVLVREGEGHAQELEGAIRALLGITAARFAPVPGDDPDLSRIRTAEIYFGAIHPTPQDRAQHPRQGEAAYVLPASGPAPGGYQLGGNWQRDGEALVLRSPRGSLRVRFSAAMLHLVAAAPNAATLRLTVDGASAPPVEIGRPTLYTLVDGANYGEHVLVIEADTPGLSLFSATFG